MPKIISLDLDGTLLKNDKTISKETMNTLEKLMSTGREVVINTGRPYHMTHSVLPTFFHSLTWICSNGAGIYKQGKLCYSLPLKNDSFHCFVTTLLREFPELCFGIDVGSYSITFNNVESFYTFYKLRYIPYNTFQEQEVYSMFLSLENISEEKIKEIELILPDDFKLIYTDHRLYAMILDKNCSKLSGIEWVCQQQEYTLQEVLAFGDDLNDIEILNGVGWGVAMENAVAHIQNLCHLKTLSNEADGVKDYLEKHVLQ